VRVLIEEEDDDDDDDKDLSDKELEARSIALTSASKLLFEEKIDVGIS